MSLSRAQRAHLAEDDVAAERGGLERGFGTGKPTADDVNRFHATFRIRRPAWLNGLCRRECLFVLAGGERPPLTEDVSSVLY